MAMPDNFTKHASARAKQRGIPPLVNEWLDRFGEESHDHPGVILRYFSRQSERKMEKELGREPLRRMKDFLSVYRVESSQGSIITIGHKTQRFYRK